MDASGAIPTEVVRSILKNQYHAALAMLREGIERCPDELWAGDAYPNAVWQLAYHTLYFTHLYLHTDADAFRPWPGHQGDVQHPDGIPGPAEPGNPWPLIPTPYTREQALAYGRWCDERVDAAVDELDLGAADCGFPWYRMSKLEHQFVNLRHLQHHGAQVADRLRTEADLGVRWVGGSRPR